MKKHIAIQNTMIFVQATWFDENNFEDILFRLSLEVRHGNIHEINNSYIYFICVQSVSTNVHCSKWTKSSESNNLYTVELLVLFEILKKHRKVISIVFSA